MGKVNINAGLIGVGSRAPVLETLNATENATYTPGTGVDGYDEVNVNVEADLEDATFTENGTYESQDHDGFRSVEVNVSGGNANERELSAEEYMALTEAEKTNGTNYYIYDAMPEGKEIQPVIYSTVEREIGVWTDGKPLYQKTFLPNYQSSYSSGSHEINVAVDVHDLNIDTVVNLFGVWERYAGDHSRLLYQFGSGENQYGDAWLRVDSENGYNNGRLNATIKSENTDWQEITIQYTKTTDTAGSGIWAPSGVPAVHYDSNEKIVGTWFGETLYEKTFTGSFSVTSTSRTWYSIYSVSDLSSLHIDKCIFINGLYKEPNQSFYVDMGVMKGNDGIYCSMIYNPSEGIKFVVCNGATGTGEFIFTIRYTKTTS